MEGESITRPAGAGPVKKGPGGGAGGFGGDRGGARGAVGEARAVPGQKTGFFQVFFPGKEKAPGPARGRAVAMLLDKGYLSLLEYIRPDFVQFCVGDVEDLVVGRQFLVAHKLGGTVVFLGEAGIFVEEQLIF